MAFLIPNLAGATFPEQSELDSGDVEIFTRGLDRIGIVSGCTVTSSGAANGSVSIAAGRALSEDVGLAVSATSALISANSSGNPRFDLVTVTAAGGLSVIGGTASSTPAFPAIPAGSVVLAAVYVPNGHTTTTTIPATNIIDKRVQLAPRQFTMQVLMTSAALSSATITFPASPHLEFMAYVSGYASNGIVSLQLGTTASVDTGARYWHRNHPTTGTAVATWGTAVQAASATMMPLASNSMTLGRMTNGSIGNPNGTSHPVCWQTGNASNAPATVALAMCGNGEYVSSAAGRVVSARITTNGGNLNADSSLSITGIAGWV